MSSLFVFLLFQNVDIGGINTAGRRVLVEILFYSLSFLLFSILMKINKPKS